MHAQIAAPMSFGYPFAMRCFRLACLCLGFLALPSALAAQDAVSQQPLTIGPSGEAYLKSLGYRGIETDVAYFDPTAAMPELQTGQEPAPPPDLPEAPSALPATLRILVMVLAAVLLIGLVLLVRQVGGGFALSLQGEADNPARARRQPVARGFGDSGPPADLQTILATSDRRRALVMLVQAALARTVAANGILLQPSWTLRDALRHIPKTQAHLDALRQLVLAGERVLFGNRDVMEDEFQAHVALMRPLMSGPAA